MGAGSDLMKADNRNHTGRGQWSALHQMVESTFPQGMPQDDTSLVDIGRGRCNAILLNQTAFDSQLTESMVKIHMGPENYLEKIRAPLQQKDQRRETIQHHTGKQYR